MVKKENNNWAHLILVKGLDIGQSVAVAREAKKLAYETYGVRLSFIHSDQNLPTGFYVTGSRENAIRVKQKLEKTCTNYQYHNATFRLEEHRKPVTPGVTSIQGYEIPEDVVDSLIKEGESIGKRNSESTIVHLSQQVSQSRKDSLRLEKRLEREKGISENLRLDLAQRYTSELRDISYGKAKAALRFGAANRFKAIAEDYFLVVTGSSVDLAILAGANPEEESRDSAKFYALKVHRLNLSDRRLSDVLNCDNVKAKLKQDLESSKRNLSYLRETIDDAPDNLRELVREKLFGHIPEEQKRILEVRKKLVDISIHKSIKGIYDTELRHLLDIQDKYSIAAEALKNLKGKEVPVIINVTAEDSPNLSFEIPSTGSEEEIPLLHHIETHLERILSNVRRIERGKYVSSQNIESFSHALGIARGITQRLKANEDRIFNKLLIGFNIVQIF
jgi:hypothetical protein